MNKQFEQVREFIEIVRGIELPKEGDARSLIDDNKTDRYKFMLEEVNEFVETDDILAQVDAMVDLQYFLIGTLLEMGVSSKQFEECFNRVHGANMMKKAGAKQGREVSGIDAMKPDDWKEPDFKGIL